MNDFVEIDSLLARGAYKKVIREADKRLEGADFSHTSGIFERFSFMNGDSYTLYTFLYPDRQILWVKNLSSLLYAKAYSLNELGRHDEAIAVLTNAIETDPVTPKLRLELCSNLIRAGKYREANEVLPFIPPYITRPHDAALYYAKKAYLSSQNGNAHESRDFALYSLAFENTKAAEKELEYADTLLGVHECDRNKAIKNAARRLSEKAADFSLSDCAKKTLEYLYELYTKGGDAEKAALYSSSIESFAEVKALTEV